MVDELDRRSNSFPSEACVRCLNHIINLVAHTITHQFDNVVRKTKAKKNAAKSNPLLDAGFQPYNDNLPDDPADLLGVDGDPEEPVFGDNDLDKSAPAGLEDWIDDLSSMSDKEIAAFARDSLPVRRVLVKVCCCIYLVLSYAYAYHIFVQNTLY